MTRYFAAMTKAANRGCQGHESWPAEIKGMDTGVAVCRLAGRRLRR
jgi:hypothetical protein